MKAPRLVIAFLLVATASACRPDTVELAYEFPPDSELTYRMEAIAEARWDIQGEGQGSYRTTFEVTERVESDDSGGTIVNVVMTPLNVDEDNLFASANNDRSFSLRLGEDGESVEILEVDGVPAADLGNEEITLIGTYRPPLPATRVGLGDEWRADQEIEAGSVFQGVSLVGTLERFDRDAEGKLAELSYDGTGELTQSVALPQGDAQLTGNADVHIDASVDLEEGFLREATSSTVGEFDARIVRANEEAPIVGTLHLDLRLEISKIER